MGQKPGSFLREGGPSIVLPPIFSQIFVGQRAHWGYGFLAIWDPPWNDKSVAFIIFKAVAHESNDTPGDP